MVTPCDEHISFTPELLLEASYIIVSQSTNNSYVSNSTGCLVDVHSAFKMPVCNIFHSKMTYTYNLSPSCYSIPSFNSRKSAGLSSCFANNNVFPSIPLRKRGLLHHRISILPSLSPTDNLLNSDSDSDSQNFGAATP